MMPRTNPARYTDPMRNTRTRAEAARLIGCGTVSVSKLVQVGTLEAVKAGNRTLILKASLETLLGAPLDRFERKPRIRVRAAT